MSFFSELYRTPQRAARSLGLAGIGLATSGAVIWVLAPISMPATAEAVAAHYDANRTWLIVASIVVVGGSAFVAAWYVALAALLADDLRGRVAGWIGVVGMAIQIAALSVAFTIFAAVAYRPPAAESAQLMTDVSWLLVSLAGGPVTSVAIVAFALGLRSRGYGAGWLLPVSGFAAVAHLVVAVSFAREGFFSPVGGVEIAVPLIYQAWIAAVGVALVRGGHGVSAGGGTRTPTALATGT